MKNLKLLIEKSNNCFNVFDKKQLLIHLIELNDDDTKAIIDELKELLEKLDEINYVMKFASDVIHDNELNETRNRRNLEIGSSLEDCIEYIKQNK